MDASLHNTQASIDESTSSPQKVDYSIQPVEEEIVIEKDKIEEQDIEELKEIGLELIRDGMVAVICLAGGQGSRLGMDRNKGEFEMHLPSMKTLFQILIEKFLKIQMLAHKSQYLSHEIQQCKFIIMTSANNHVETQKFLEFNHYFGATKDSIVLME